MNNSTPAVTKRPRVLSGVQPSGKLHIGNYLGAIQQWVAAQDECENLFCVVDLHALTIPEAVDPKALRHKSRAVAALYVACGIDPARSTVFVQSHVREHSELAWVLDCVTPLGWLQRMTQFKSKSERAESIGTGLLVYPVLQAADILLYQANRVPVGEDQVQHVEITRDIAKRFNFMFGDVFVIPEARVPTAGARIMGLDTPTEKMSKSLGEGNPLHAVNLTDPPKVVKKAIMSAVTDSGLEFRFEEASPGVRNLLTIFSAFTGERPGDIGRRYDGRGYGYLKKDLADVVLNALLPIRTRYEELMADPGHLDAMLAEGASRARELATATMARVRDAVGIG